MHIILILLYLIGSGIISIIMEGFRKILTYKCDCYTNIYVTIACTIEYASIISLIIFSIWGFKRILLSQDIEDYHSLIAKSRY